MRVLHLSTFDVMGGAARGAYWLHRELKQQGVDSTMLVARKYGDDEDVVQYGGTLGRLSNRARVALDALPLYRYRRTADSFWTLGWLPSQVDRAVEALAPDLVHLHWVGGGFVPLDLLRRFRCPVVWTLRDMWALTGGCHYSAGCERYLAGCGLCPQLRSNDRDDVSHRTWLRKKDEWSGTDLWLVAISTWLAECAEKTPIFEDMPITVIPNGIDTRRFRAVDKSAAKAAWNFEAGRHQILYGAVGALDDPRKGFAHFVEAARCLAGRGGAERAEIVVFGYRGKEALPDLGLPTRSVGWIEDDKALARLYAAADVMVAPSAQEAFGKTLVEAMACGTPVVAFESGGPVDIVDHQETGYLATPFDSAALADGMAWCLADPDRTRRLGDKARRKAASAFDIAIVAQQYRALYRRILARVP